MHKYANYARGEFRPRERRQCTDSLPHAHANAAAATQERSTPERSGWLLRRHGRFYGVVQSSAHPPRATRSCPGPKAHPPRDDARGMSLGSMSARGPRARSSRGQPRPLAPDAARYGTARHKLAGKSAASATKAGHARDAGLPVLHDYSAASCTSSSGQWALPYLRDIEKTMEKRN